MSNIFNPDGERIPVTVIQAGPCKVTNVRTKEKDGYEALQLGFGEKKEKNISKPVLGHFKKNNLTPGSVLKEFRKFNDCRSYKIGDELKS
jgi:large subunit ribosomal protein L3